MFVDNAGDLCAISRRGIFRLRGEDLGELGVDATTVPVTASEMVLPPGTEKFAISYTALSLLIPERVHFKYQMEGYDEDWIDAGLSSDPNGKQITPHPGEPSNYLAAEPAELLGELEALKRNGEHIKESVAMPQNYAQIFGVSETVGVAELVEDALVMNTGSLARHGVQLRRDFEDNLPRITVEKHKVLQILVDVIRNANHACDESGKSDKQITVRVRYRACRLTIAIVDNGVGMLDENGMGIVNRGFTTRKNGHGFGLPGAALAAGELGGELRVESAGIGRGACFTLELALTPPAKKCDWKVDRGFSAMRLTQPWYPVYGVTAPHARCGAGLTDCVGNCRSALLSMR